MPLRLLREGWGREGGGVGERERGERGRVEGGAENGPPPAGERGERRDEHSLRRRPSGNEHRVSDSLRSLVF